MGFTQKELDSLIAVMKERADEKYKKFNDSLIPGLNETSIGLRVPAVRELAKEITRGDWRGFLALTGGSDIYEIRLLRGMVIGGAKCSLDERLSLLADFIPEIDNWAVCDGTVGELKCFAKDKDRAFGFAVSCLNSPNEYEVRFGCVVLLRWLIDSEHIADILRLYDSVRHDGYYVKMAVAWGISMCFVKFREETLAYLRRCSLDDFTFNKSIQKMTESYQVCSEDKEMLRAMKRKCR